MSSPSRCARAWATSTARVTANVKVGAMVEYLVTPGRPRHTTRVGPLALIGFRKDFEGLFTATMVVSGPDDLGLYASTYGFAGVRYRWAARF